MTDREASGNNSEGATLPAPGEDAVMTNTDSTPAAPAESGAAVSSDGDALPSPGPKADEVTPMSADSAEEGSATGSGQPKQKKKPRLQWDEQNLIHNALEMERSAYPKIDEPKTPFHAGSSSEGGSVSSGSAPHSPGSPAFISRDNLVGFSEVEQSAFAERQNSTPNSLQSRGSGDGQSRSVHYPEDACASSGGESSPRSREEFEAKRKNHYKKEHPRYHHLGDSGDPSEVADDEDAVEVEASGLENGTDGRLGGEDEDDNLKDNIDDSRATDGREENGHGGDESEDK